MKATCVKLEENAKDSEEAAAEAVKKVRKEAEDVATTATSQAVEEGERQQAEKEVKAKVEANGALANGESVGELGRAMLLVEKSEKEARVEELEEQLDEMTKSVESLCRELIDRQFE